MMEIFITTQFVGFHKWDDAPNEVIFLRNKHRHLFKVRVWFKVTHDDRELEFLLMKKKVEDYLEAFEFRQDVGSCEMICKELVDIDARITKVEVSEDGENGAILTL